MLVKIINLLLSLCFFSEWPEWKQHFPDMSKIQIVRLPAHCGVACAKNKGARLVADTHHTKRSDELVVVFLDSHSVVSSQWLVPLANTLEKAPDAGNERI